jgi:hypothetical protein
VSKRTTVTFAFAGRDCRHAYDRALILAAVANNATPRVIFKHQQLPTQAAGRESMQIKVIRPAQHRG